MYFTSLFRWLFLFAVLLLSDTAHAKSFSDSAFRLFVKGLAKNNSNINLPLHQYKMVKGFYEYNDYQRRWFSTIADSSNRNNLRDLLANADSYGLGTRDFHYALFGVQQSNTNATDTFTAEVMYTDAALSFMHDLAYGGDYKFVKYNGLQYHPDHLDLIKTLHEAFDKANFTMQLTLVEPAGEKFTCMKEEYLRLLAIYKNEYFNEVIIKSREIKVSNKALVQKLVQLGYATDADSTDVALKAAVQLFQKQHSLLVQNAINPYCLEVLNKTIAYRLEELTWNITWYRWLNGMKDKPHVVVNIPSNNLNYYENGTSKLESKIVVGKISTPTPTLTSQITQVIYYPYWNVPHSIATKEILPVLKKFPGYQHKLKLDVLRNGKVVSSINWAAYSANNFPFQLRQKTGCNNALGLLKFEFENPFHVYLHDTNAKSAFMASKRFFSHGCMRVEQPYKLAVALGIQPEKINMDTCLNNRTPQPLLLPQPIPVFVIYASIDFVNGQMQWHDDAYHLIRKENLFK